MMMMRTLINNELFKWNIYLRTFLDYGTYVKKRVPVASFSVTDIYSEHRQAKQD